MPSLIGFPWAFLYGLRRMTSLLQVEKRGPFDIAPIVSSFDIALSGMPGGGRAAPGRVPKGGFWQKFKQKEED
ncbi:MAG TPA: hypothetical protein VIH99_03900 [Bdellovibrionota bacterium]